MKCEWEILHVRSKWLFFNFKAVKPWKRDEYEIKMLSFFIINVSKKLTNVFRGTTGETIVMFFLSQNFRETM